MPWAFPGKFLTSGGCTPTGGQFQARRPAWRPPAIQTFNVAATRAIRGGSYKSEVILQHREAIVDIPANPPNTVVARRRRPTLTLVDYLVIAASVLTFLVVAGLNISHARAQRQAHLTSTHLAG